MGFDMAHIRSKFRQTYLEDRKTTAYDSAADYADAHRNYVAEYRKWENACQTFQTQQWQSLISSSANIASPPPPPTNSFSGFGPERVTGLPVGTFETATIFRRVVAELIDFFICLMIKICLLLFLIEYDIVDVEPYQKMIDENHNLFEFISLTQSLLSVDLVCKVLCAILEGVVMAYNIGPCKRGQTPGKWIVGIRVISADQVTTSPIPNHVQVHGPREISLNQSFFRSMLKNVVVNSLFPLSTIAFNLSATRSFYDAALRTIVVYG